VKNNIENFNKKIVYCDLKKFLKAKKKLFKRKKSKKKIKNKKLEIKNLFNKNILINFNSCLN